MKLCHEQLPVETNSHFSQGQMGFLDLEQIAKNAPHILLNLSEGPCNLKLSFKPTELILVH